MFYHLPCPARKFIATTVWGHVASLVDCWLFGCRRNRIFTPQRQVDQWGVTWLEGQIFRSFTPCDARCWLMLIAEQSHPLVSLDARGNGNLEAFGYSHLLDELNLKISLRGFGKVLRGQRILWGIWLDCWPVSWLELRKSALGKIGSLAIQAAENGVQPWAKWLA